MKITRLVFYLMTIVIISCQANKTSPNNPHSKTSLLLMNSLIYMYVDNYNVYEGGCELEVEFLDPLMGIDSNKITNINIPPIELGKADIGKKTIEILTEDSLVKSHRILWKFYHRGIDHFIKDTIFITPFKPNSEYLKNMHISKNPDIADSEWKLSGNSVIYDVWVKNNNEKIPIRPIFEITSFSYNGVEIGKYQVSSKSFIPPDDLKKYKVTKLIDHSEIASQFKIGISKVEYDLSSIKINKNGK